MNSRPGSLKGSHIRRLPARYLTRFEAKGRASITSARYRVTGYRDPQGAWVSRVKVNSAGSYGYRRRIAGKLLVVKPTDREMRRSALIAVEVEITRGDTPTVYYTTLRGPLGG